MLHVTENRPILKFSDWDRLDNTVKKRVKFANTEGADIVTWTYSWNDDLLCLPSFGGGGGWAYRRGIQEEALATPSDWKYPEVLQMRTGATLARITGRTARIRETS